MHYEGFKLQFGTPVYEGIDAPASREQKAVLEQLTPDMVEVKE